MVTGSTADRVALVVVNHFGIRVIAFGAEAVRDLSALRCSLVEIPLPNRLPGGAHFLGLQREGIFSRAYRLLIAVIQTVLRDGAVEDFHEDGCINRQLLCRDLLSAHV